jgi:sigma-B regulation protein RsbU (phosphoserine phosphatase)
MKLRVVVLLALAALIVGTRTATVYMRYVSADLRSYLPLKATHDSGYLVISSLEPEAPGFKGRPTAELPRKGDRIVAVYDASGQGGVVRGMFDWGAYIRPIDTKASWLMVVDRPRSGGVDRLILRMPPAVPLNRDFAETLTDLGFDIYLPAVALVAGLFIGLLRPRDNQAFLAALVFLGFSASFRQSVSQLPAGWREAALLLRTTAAYFTPYLLLEFFFRFPARSVLDRRCPWIRPMALAITTLCWAVGLSLGFASATSFQAYQSLHALFERALIDVDRFDAVFTDVAAVTILIALAAAVLNAVKAETQDDRRRMRLISAGAVTGLLPIAVLYGLGAREVKTPLWLLLIGVPLIGVFPLSFVYAVVRHRVFGIRLILHRGLQYALVSRGFLVFEGVVIFAGLFFGVGPVLGTLSPATDPKIASVGIVVATLVLLGGVRRVNQGVLPAIDRHFFREAYNVQQILTDLSRAVRRLASRPDQLLARITDEISAALHPDQVAIFLTDGPWPHLRPLDGSGPVCWEGEVAGKRQRFVLHVHHEPDREDSRKVQTGAALSTRLPLSRYLASAIRDPGTLDVTPVKVFQAFEGFAHGPARGGPCLEDRELFERFDARLLVPLVTGGRALGFLVLGEKLSEEPYTAENKELLLTVAEQVAIALDYSQLIGQVAEQETLKREIQIAQEVQARLFPHELPPLETLRYGGVCRAARGVGGDYYDFLSLGPGRLGIAVADIAGKGLPAALLMASLQALLRSHAPSCVHDLGELARELNRHLCESSDEARFATLFFGVYDDASRSLRFLNAGHLPPLLLRRDGSGPPRVERLQPNGTVLGLFTDLTYEQQQVTLEPGDLLAVFSDGVTDAINAEGELFGEERLVDVLSSQWEVEEIELTKRVLDEVDRFVGTAPQQDDITFIAARVA